MKKCDYCDGREHVPCASKHEAGGCKQYKSYCATAVAVKVPSAEGKASANTRMRLANLSAVAELAKSLEYLDTIRDALNSRTQARVKVEGIDLRPSIVARVVSAIEAAIETEAASTRDHLLDLGVEV